MNADLFAKKSVFVIWLLVCCTLAFIFYANFIKKSNINSDLSSILPLESQEAVQLEKLFNKATVNQVLWLLKAKDEKSLIAEANRLAADLDSSEILKIINHDAKSSSLLFDKLVQNQGIYLSDRDRELLINNDFGGITRSKIEQLYSPISVISSEILEKDPLLLTTNYLQQTFTSNKTILLDDYIGYQDGDETFLLVNLELKGSPFDLELQVKYLSFLESQVSELARKKLSYCSWELLVLLLMRLSKD